MAGQTVFVLTEEYDYEGSTLLGVYSSEDHAKAAVVHYFHKHYSGQGKMLAPWENGGANILYKIHPSPELVGHKTGTGFAIDEVVVDDSPKNYRIE